MPDVVINESYWTQRVSGQQRYATEIEKRLALRAGFRSHRPTGFWAGHALRVWAWVQLVLPLAARGAVLLSMTARAPLWCRRQVLVVHDLFVLQHPEWFSRRYVWTHAPLLRLQLRTAASVIAVSEPVADQVRQVRPGRVVVAPNAPSEVFRQPDSAPSAALVAAGVEPGSYFVAVGNRDPRKNLACLAAAYGQFTVEQRMAHPLVIVGGDAAIYRAQEIAWPTGTVDVGYVPDEELRRIYRDARAVVFVSLAEGFGLPIVEAAAAGAPSLIVSDIPVFRWICGEHATYVDPASPDSVAAALLAQATTSVHGTPEIDRFSWDASADIIAAECHRLTGVAVPPMDRELQVAVVIASAGRPGLLAEILGCCKKQVGADFQLVVSVPDETSLPSDAGALDGVMVVSGVRGLAAQRNAALDALTGTDLVIFFDDDAVPRHDYVANAVAFLQEHPHVVGMTGRVILDGKVTGEISHHRTDAALRMSEQEASTGYWTKTRELYGANFAVRVDYAPELRFDERLPLYSWLEDHDFARRLKVIGPLANVHDCVIVHRAAASGGRQSHLRLGYSQVMNAIHLQRKGSFPLWLCVQQIFRVVAKNTVLSAGGRSKKWRRTRLHGNALAFQDAVRGRITPERILDLS